jgi:hypothetical protein
MNSSRNVITEWTGQTVNTSLMHHMTIRSLNKKITFILPLLQLDGMGYTNGWKGFFCEEMHLTCLSYPAWGNFSQLQFTCSNNTVQ